jgi:phage/plasmid primase, P4 family, C-terminal domain
MNKQLQYKMENYDLGDLELIRLHAQVKACACNTSHRRLCQYELDEYVPKSHGILKNSKEKKYLDNNLFAQYIKKRLVAITVNSNIYLYNIKMGIYEKINDIILKKFMREILSECSLDFWNISAENNYFTAFIRDIATFKELPVNPRYIVFKNGIYDLNSKKFRNKFTSKLYAFTSLPYNFDSEAEAPIWIQTVNDIFNSNTEIINSLQELFGYCFYHADDYPIQKIFIFYGRGRNGKGIICNILEKLVGEDNVSHVLLDDLQERFGKQNLQGKYINISSEADQKKPFNTATIKSITGGDRVEIERKYEQAFTARIGNKFIVCSNHSIKTDDNSVGFYERLHVFKFTNVYKEKKIGQELSKGVKVMNKQLNTILQKELSGIFNWALEGYYRLKANNWNMTKCDDIQKISHEYFIKANPVEHFFDACIEKGSLKDKIDRPQIYMYFNQWAHTNNIDINGYQNKNEFYYRAKQCLQDLGATSDAKKSGDSRYFVGIKMKQGWIKNTCI